MNLTLPWDALGDTYICYIGNFANKCLEEVDTVKCIANQLSVRKQIYLKTFLSPLYCQFLLLPILAS